MPHTTSTLTTNDGLRLFTQIWQPEQPKAAILLVHGLSEHSQRYEHVAAGLVAAGYAVYTLDHRAHGRSEGQPRSFVSHIDQIVDDLKAYWDTLPADLPRFVLGHSLGGLLAVRFTLRYQDAITGLVTSGAALLPDPKIPGFIIGAGNLLARFAPRLPLVKLASDKVSRDPDVVSAYHADPLVFNGMLRAGMAATVIQGGYDALARVDTLRLPLLILHGEADAIVPAAASQALYDKAGSADKTLKLYPGLYHEILNEPEKEAILQTIIGWLDAHLPG